MKKGLEALELIFTLFVLIVVVLIVVRMFIQQMKIGKIQEPLKRWEDVNRYQSARSECEIFCEAFRNNPGDINVIKDYCTHRAPVDLNGDGKTYENLPRNYRVSPGRVVSQVPYCEDGIYCFHIYDCYSGSIHLTPSTCLQYLCEYYMSPAVGYDAELAMEAIKKEITYGKCDPNTVYVKLGDRIITPSYWWEKAGYNSPDCENIVYEVTEGEEIPELLPPPLPTTTSP